MSDGGNAPKPLRIALIVSAIALAGLNLRFGVTVVGPLIPQIRDGLDADSATAGALASTSIVLFGVFALAAPRLVQRSGIPAALLGSLILVALGSAIRAMESLTALFCGMLLIGAGIGVMNVVMPALVRVAFPHRIALGTAIYTSALNIGSALAALMAVPLAARADWRLPLWLTALPALLAALMWVVPPVRVERAAMARPSSPRVLLRSPVAWLVTTYMGLQSVLYYVLMVWLPTVFVDAGVSETAAGGYLSSAQVAQLLSCLLLPIVARRRESYPLMGAIAALLTGVAYAGILFAPTALPLLWVLVLGFGQGAALTIALTFVADRAATTTVALSLSGLAQCLGYIAAAVVPILVGGLRDHFASWTPALMPMLLLCAIEAVVALALRGGRRVGTGP